MRQFIDIINEIQLLETKSTLSNGAVIDLTQTDFEQNEDYEEIVSFSILASISNEIVGRARYHNGSVIDVKVNDDYRRLGIASAIYDYIEKLGYDVESSGDLTSDGKAFWDNRRKGNARVR